MQMVKSYEFRAHFPPCELDIGREPISGGGAANRNEYAMDRVPDTQRLPLYICGPLILLLSVGCYVAGYEILAASIRFFGAF